MSRLTVMVTLEVEVDVEDYVSNAVKESAAAQEGAITNVDLKIDSELRRYDDG